MKDNKNKAILLVSFLLGFGVGSLIVALITHNNGDTATWFGGIAALVAVIFVYLQLKYEQEDWNNEHKSDIEVQMLVVPAYERVGEAGGYGERDWRNLKIWAVNKKYGSGAYRFVGICKKKDYDSIKKRQFEDPERIFNKTNSLLNLIDDTKYDTSQRYETIKGRSVSKTQTIDGEYLYDFLSRGESDTELFDALIIYVDPFNNPTIFEHKFKLNELRKNVDKNIGIAYDPEFLSKEEIGKIKYNNVEIKEHNFNLDAPKADLIHSICLFLINSVVEGAIGNGTYDLLKIAYRNFKQKRLFHTDSSNNKTIATAKIVITDRNNKKVNVVFEKEPTDIEWLNINDVIRHLKNGDYIVKLNENGRINIWTILEYAQYRHDQQEKK